MPITTKIRHPGHTKVGINEGWLDQNPRPIGGILGLTNQIRSRRNKLRPKPLIWTRGKIFPDPVGPGNVSEKSGDDALPSRQTH